LSARDGGVALIATKFSQNPALRGNNARFVIDAATSEIRSKGYVPR
jgi:hypothetical protein